jgi:hypothetical protein
MIILGGTMRKKLYICGDSFCGHDPDYSHSWVNEFTNRHPELEIHNLSSPAASNYLIYLQVKEALANNCNYIIYHATSSIRHEFVLTADNATKDSYDRYWNVLAPIAAPMVSISWPNPHHTANQVINETTQKEMQEFFFKHVDLQSLIEKNYVFIQYTLSLLSASDTRWLWSQGGFEHPAFGNVRSWGFDRTNESTINLWDHYKPKVVRPYHHVNDTDIIKKVCDHYESMLNL